MAEYFSGEGLRAVAVHSGPGSAPRAHSLERLDAGEQDVVFAVDMFNEGVGPFLERLEVTQMTRSYKMLVLLAMIGGDKLPRSRGIDELTATAEGVGGGFFVARCRSTSPSRVSAFANRTRRR